MRTIRVKLYKFSELSKEAQQTAIERYRTAGGLDASFIYDEAHHTVKEFHELFETKEGARSWLDVNTGHIDDNILELKGIRLRTYLINNYGKELYKRKYLGCIDNKCIKHRMCEPKSANGKQYTFVYSNISVENSCVLTGVWYDNSLLAPIYEFIEKGHKTDSFKYLTFDMLITDCFDSLTKDIEREEDAMNEDEYITEQIENNDYEFTKDGKLA